VQALAVERSADDGITFLAVTGEVDIASSPRMIAALNEVVTDGANPLVVDLSAVGFMDSTGLALLLNARRRMSRRRLGFAVVCPSGPLHRVFEVTDMIDTLGVYEERSAATAAVARKGGPFI
jgi:anti-sigma B factor antagonist